MVNLPLMQLMFFVILHQQSNSSPSITFTLFQPLVTLADVILFIKVYRNVKGHSIIWLSNMGIAATHKTNEAENFLNQRKIWIRLYRWETWKVTRIVSSKLYTSFPTRNFRRGVEEPHGWKHREYKIRCIWLHDEELTTPLVDRP